VHASPLLVHCADAADEAFCRDAQSCFKQLPEKMSGVTGKSVTVPLEDPAVGDRLVYYGVFAL
jgi:hypothetical protein